MKSSHSHPLASKTPVSSIMSKHFPVIRDTVHLDQLTSFLLEHKITCAAVSDASGKLIGYVSMIDLVRDRYLNGETEDTEARAEIQKGMEGDLRSGFHLEPTPRATVRDIMMPFVLRLPGSACIERAAALMAFEGVPSVVIVSPSGVVIGLVTALDVLRWLGDRQGHVSPESAKSKWRSSCEYMM